MNAVMETAASLNSPVVIQFSNSGGAFVAGKGIGVDSHQASVLGSLAGADHVNRLAEHYGARVILHTDHCAKKLLPWVDGLLDAGEKHHAATGKPLPRVYVKVYYRTSPGDKGQFYKDGHTDIRGVFDYAALNTDQLSRTQRFALLVMSDSHGAVVVETPPPSAGR